MRSPKYVYTLGTRSLFFEISGQIPPQNVVLTKLKKQKQEIMLRTLKKNSEITRTYGLLGLIKNY